MELLIHVHAAFTIHNRSNSNYYVRLYDRDFLTDDFLAEEKLNEDGIVHFTINPTSYRTADSFREKRPDFYFTIINEGEEIFRTPVADNIDLNTEADFNTEEGMVIDMGGFVVSGS